MDSRSILQINTALNWSATGKIAEQILSIAKSLGWNCYTAHGARYVLGNSVANDISTDFRLNDYADAAASMIGGRHGLGSKYVTRELVKKINAISPDIIHLHNIHGYYLNYPILFRFLAQSKSKVVWTLHDCWSMTGHCTHFDEIGCEKWKSQCHDCPLLHAGYKSLFFDRSRSNYQLKKQLFTSVPNMTIVTVSEWLRGKVEESFLKNYPVRVIRNGIDLDVFKPVTSDLRNKLQIADGKIVLLGVASAWGKGKGLNEFCELSKNDSYQVILIWVADSVQKHIPNNIIALKRTTDQKELAAYYTMADVYVNPTHCDSFPTVNLEALACGTPVVTYRTGGSPEAVDANTGIVVDKGDFKGLVDAINFIHSHKEQYSPTECRRRAEHCFDKRNCFLNYIDLYQSILS